LTIPRESHREGSVREPICREKEVREKGKKHDKTDLKGEVGDL
jgi:hypothetical protein